MSPRIAEKKTDGTTAPIIASIGDTTSRLAALAPYFCACQNLR
jgi:hypothetical protein